ncbi:Uncharacterised protein [[Clostridium] sordellii]|uniref:hypothetical protein n=1 Tax=Paraclostridium sordellii TaxID=1505 RepID=UPI0005DA7D22|nr:hypothetical protein [Paeniclostridium sordellii]CEO06891.1 Uncharacterised protein [[Clostridium] sordellii] [Paeniclostridium sordellii]CEP86706.1 Uncharacterised protein [[Clostridium] sordellii] [Paeniclostridium sordellii]
MDTIIGYNDNLYDKDRFNDFKEFEKDKFKIKENTFNNIIITIDSKKFILK